MIEANRLYMFTVYNRPSDYPDEFVVRRCWVEDCQVKMDAELWARGPTLESVRAQIPPDQVCMRASAHDQPSIVEVWF